MSSERIRLALVEPKQATAALRNMWRVIAPLLEAGQRLHLEVRRDTRSTAQNRLMWACLACLAEQVNWHGQHLTAEEWKDVLTASLRRQRVVPGIDGGFVVLGQSTRAMTKAEMTELIDLAHAFGDQKGVRWTPQALGSDWAGMEG